MTTNKSSKSEPKSTKSAPHGGMPGDGAGRTDDPGSRHAGVWPASGPPADDPNLPYQPMASFGQGERGAAGYEDSGRSEVRTMPPGDSGETSDEAR